MENTFELIKNSGYLTSGVIYW